MGGCLSFSYGKNNIAILERNLYDNNIGTVAAILDFEIKQGLTINIENTYLRNIGYSYWGNKIGSGAIGSFRGTEKFVNYMLNENMMMNWAEAQGL